MIITSCNKSSFLLIEQEKQKPSYIYLNQNNKESILLDTIGIVPEDMRFIYENRIIYGGDKVIELKDFNGGKRNLNKNQIPNSLAEQFSSLALMNNNFVIVDSLDFSYYSDELVKQNKSVLLGYDSTLQKKEFSIILTEKGFTTNLYFNSSDNLRYVFYPDYKPKSVSANDYIIQLEILDLKNNSVQVFDTIFVSNQKKGFQYFNPRYVRDEKNGKLSYMKITESNDNSKMHITIFEWDYKIAQKSKLFDIDVDKILVSDNFKHRIVNDKLYLAFDFGIMSFDKRGNKKNIYSNDKRKILDFWVH